MERKERRIITIYTLHLMMTDLITIVCNRYFFFFLSLLSLSFFSTSLKKLWKEGEKERTENEGKN